ncbi:MAG: phosphatase PAP2 family protein [Flavobacteriales bacterium]|nr:phosphatase PAP2 family protein [Flavobacteriales bacterium]
MPTLSQAFTNKMIFDTIEQLDQELFLFLNQFHADWLDFPMFLISWPVFWLPVYVFFFYTLSKRYPKLNSILLGLLCLGVTIGGADSISTRGFKYTVKRYRPTHHHVIGPQTHTVENFDGNEYRGGKYGFISGHAANFFGIATYFFLLFGRNRNHRWLFAWAGLIAYSRIYLGVHYPLDIIGGTMAGVLMGFISFRLFLFFQRKIEPA